MIQIFPSLSNIEADDSLGKFNDFISIQLKKK